MLLILIIQPNYVEINLKNNYYLLYNIFLRLKWNAYLIIILEGQVLEKVLKYQSRDLNKFVFMCIAFNWCLSIKK